MTREVVWRLIVAPTLAGIAAAIGLGCIAYAVVALAGGLRP